MSGKPYFIDADGEYWRIYNWIENAKTYDIIDNTEMFFNIGKAFGNFHKKLVDYPSETLYEAIPDFHNTPKRLEDFTRSVIEDKVGRLKKIKYENNHPLKIAIDKILECREELGCLEQGKKLGGLPVRVTHNDTKINNVMIDEKTGVPICIIDLDTVGPDTVLVDYGDAIRTGANRAGEEPENIESAVLDIELFKAYTKGYIDETLIITDDGTVNNNPIKGLTKNEIELMYKAPKILTMESAMRFLEDYLNGDEYFKLKEGQSQDHNLKRGLVQLHLAEDMAAKEQEMKQYIDFIIMEKTQAYINI